MRLFWALDLPDDVKDRLEAVQTELRARCPQGVRWVRRDQLHVTCKFLGDVPAWEPIAEAARALPKPGPLALEVTGLGTFGGRRPRVVWAGLGGPGLDAFTALVGDLEDALIPLGFPREARPFKAHVTLGRAKQRRRGPPSSLAVAVDQVLLPASAVEARELVLFQSSFGERSGPVRYEAVARFSFGP